MRSLSQAGDVHLQLIPLQSRITALEEEREETLSRLQLYEELQAANGESRRRLEAPGAAPLTLLYSDPGTEMLQAKLAAYEEQQRTLQADLEQFTKRAASQVGRRTAAPGKARRFGCNSASCLSQASESGSADDTQSQVLEWQEMVAEAASTRERAKEERAAMALRISHMEEEREGKTAAGQSHRRWRRSLPAQPAGSAWQSVCSPNETHQPVLLQPVITGQSYTAFSTGCLLPAV